MMNSHTTQLVFFFLSLAGCFAVDSLRFLIIGDMGGLPNRPFTTIVETSTALEMGKVAERYDTKFILELGDNFYYSGVQNLSDKRFQETFENVYTADSLQVPWYLIAGNHDHIGNVSAEIEYSKKSERWNFPDYYYYLEKAVPGGKTVGFVMIDTILLCGNTHDEISAQPEGPKSGLEANKQWNFIIQSLNQSKADYLFVAGHFPIYSIAEHGPTKCLVDGLLPLLDKFEVNGYLNGHDHNLQHLQVKSSRGKNIDFFVSGMANFIDPSMAHKDSVPSGSCKFHYANLFSFGGFLFAEATASNMTMSFLNALGHNLYTTTIYPRQ